MKESTNSPETFDFLFIGLGAANCLLLLRMHANGLFQGKTMAIIEPNNKSSNDRTFCFWATEEEVSNLGLQNLISHRWENIEINGITKQAIAPLYYYHVQGIDLYNHTKTVLGQIGIKRFSSALIKPPHKLGNNYGIELNNESILASKVFDSRPPSFETPTKNEAHLLQSFYGWKIKTQAPAFDTSTMLMMDFKIPQDHYTQFVYVLPFSDDTALIELTRFGSQKLDKDASHLILKNYIQNLGLEYDILDYEQGIIPMSSAQIMNEDHGQNWLSMGARAGMLKSTTGYAFHAMAEDAIIQMEGIKNNALPQRQARKSRFAFYDRLLLKILDEQPAYGKIIFETLFKRVPILKVLSFLREKTSLAEDISIFAKLPKRVFIAAAIKDIWHRLPKLPVVVWPMIFTLLSIALMRSPLESMSHGILVLGFLTVGLSHGALDHLCHAQIKNKKQMLSFVANYLFKGLLLGIVWYLVPNMALLLFIAYSAWHFGQADFREWKLKQGVFSFLWGMVVLLTILFFHFMELQNILQQIPNLTLPQILNKITANELLSIQIILIIAGLLLAVFNKSKYLFFTLVYLLLSSLLPLLVSFGIYFIGQHSMHGWRHLVQGLKHNSLTLWRHSLPFSIGGAVLILCIPLVAAPHYLGLFFILLSCLSIPHVLSMHHFYAKVK
jgi:lycopene beta-cyclase